MVVIASRQVPADESLSLSLLTRWRRSGRGFPRLCRAAVEDHTARRVRILNALLLLWMGRWELRGKTWYENKVMINPRTTELKPQKKNCGTPLKIRRCEQAMHTLPASTNRIMCPRIVEQSWNSLGLWSPFCRFLRSLIHSNLGHLLFITPENDRQPPKIPIRAGKNDSFRANPPRLADRFTPVLGKIGLMICGQLQALPGRHLIFLLPQHTAAVTHLANSAR